jgi:hypothetical protein
MLEAVSAELPWDLVLTYAKMPRWKPADVARSAEEIVSRLQAHGVPVTVHEPSLYLSIPYNAEVRSEAGTFRAKPPAYSTRGHRECRPMVIHDVRPPARGRDRFRPTGRYNATGSARGR